MKNMAFFFIAAFFAVACSLPDPGCDDGSCLEKDKCTYLVEQKEHKPMFPMVDLVCDKKKNCSGRIYFRLLPDSVQFYSQGSYASTKGCTSNTLFSYLLKKDSIVQNISFVDPFDFEVTVGEVVSFSIIDTSGIEKKFTFEVPSYSVKNDSLVINLDKMDIDCVKLTRDKQICGLSEKDHFMVPLSESVDSLFFLSYAIEVDNKFNVDSLGVHCMYTISQ